MSVTMSWVFLFIAGVLEICWAIGLKYSEGFTKLTPSIFTIITLFLSMYFLSRACEVLPIGTAYGVWVGVGALGTAVMGIVLFSEPVSFARMGFLMLLFISVIGLKLTSGRY